MVPARKTAENHATIYVIGLQSPAWFISRRFKSGKNVRYSGLPLALGEIRSGDPIASLFRIECSAILLRAVVASPMRGEQDEAAGVELCDLRLLPMRQAASRYTPTPSMIF